MKKTIIFIISFTIFVVFAPWGNGFAAEDLVKAAGLLKFQGTVNAPEFMAEDLNGDKWRLSDYHGKVVLLSFWTTW